MAKPKTAVELYESLKDGLKQTYVALLPRSTYTPIPQAMPMLLQAIFAFETGLTGASILSLRSAVESAGYLFLTREPAGESGEKRAPPRDLAGEIRRVEFEEILRGLRTRRVLDEALLQAASRIKDDGNLAAHVQAINDRAVDRSVRRVWNASVEDRDPRIAKLRKWPSQKALYEALKNNPESGLNLFFDDDEPYPDPIRLFPSEEEVASDIQDGISIFLALILAYGRKNPIERKFARLPRRGPNRIKSDLLSRRLGNPKHRRGERN
jgi:hypothetical protein